MTRRVRLFPLNAVLFPGAVLNVHVFEPRYKQMLTECIDAGEGFGVALIADGAETGDADVVPHTIGSFAEIIEVMPLPFGRYYVSTIGRRRFRIRAIVSREPFLTVDAEFIDDEPFDDDDEMRRLADGVRRRYAEYRELLVEFSGEEAAPALPADPCEASYLVGDGLQIAPANKQRLLELDDTKARLHAELTFLQRALPQLRSLTHRRRDELEKRKEHGESRSYRADQERFFGKSFSLN